MSGSAGDVGTGAVKGAALGAALGPYGAAGGAVLGGLYGFLSGGPSDAEKAAAAANSAHVANGKQNAIALENYRQAARDQYHQLLTNETTPYQAYSNRLAAGWGGSGMSTAGLAANENPLTLQETGIGAPEGSNYTGYDTGTGHLDLGNGKSDDRTTYHVGIGAQIGDPNAVDPDGASSVNGARSVGASGMKYSSVVDPNADVAQYLNPANNSTYSPASASLPQGGGPQQSSQLLRFAPRQAP